MRCVLNGICRYPQNRTPIKTKHFKKWPKSIGIIEQKLRQQKLFSGFSISRHPAY
jgi:hypothetical protein